MEKILLFLFLTSCSSLHMKRPEAEVNDALEASDLFGEWKNSYTTLNIACTGSFDFVEKRNGRVIIKDRGGDISKLNKARKEITVSSPFGNNTYYYRMKSPDELEFLVGKRSNIIESFKKECYGLLWWSLIS